MYSYVFGVTAEHSLTPDLYVFAGAFTTLALIVSYILIDRLIKWAKRHRVLDVPTKRSSHTRPTPKGAGIAISGLTLLGLMFAWVIHPTISARVLFSFVVGAVLVSVVSWVDDLRSIPVSLRLLVHSAVSAIVLISFGYWTRVDLPAGGNLQLGWWGGVVSFFWIVGLINAYNFMDGIDGIAGAQALIAGLGWSLIGVVRGDWLMLSLGLLIVSTSLGFLLHNWAPARIFMGDVGSAFLGYCFSVLTLYGGLRDSILVVAGVLFVWPFLFDTCFTIFRRLAHREIVFQAHHSHLYQRLIEIGFSHSAVTLIYAVCAAFGVMMGVGLALRVRAAEIMLFFAIPTSCLVLWLFVVTQERRRRSPQPG